ncbi:hypothetical protein [Nonomuraea typhae]|uniref:hypothetical protein n=1 Tax=Nonomuraea typhae TaxID=2603600 RepID=UPI0012FC4A9B|nr:hypothetical protein [Nonomuraea typhae]
MHILRRLVLPAVIATAALVSLPATARAEPPRTPLGETRFTLQGVKKSGALISCLGSVGVPRLAGGSKVTVTAGVFCDAPVSRIQLAVGLLDRGVLIQSSVNRDDKYARLSLTVDTIPTFCSTGIEFQGVATGRVTFPNGEVITASGAGQPITFTSCA